MSGLLTDKVVFVTGAARGIGRAACVALVDAGARVAAGVRSPADAPALAAELGDRALVLACDVTDDASVEAAFAAIDTRWGRLDALVNNAGTIEPIGRLADTEPAQWMRALEINVGGAYRCARQALPRLQSHGGGVIVNVSSGAALRARAGWSAYCTSKAGLLMLSQAIHEEYSSLGVQAIGFAPGMVDTPMQSRIRESGMNEVSRTPRSALLDPAWPARVIGWLASGRAARFSGRDTHISNADLMAAMAVDGLTPPAG